MNAMRELRIAKVVLNIGVGEAGDRLSKAETVLQKLTGCQPVRTLSRTTNRDLGLRKGMPIGCKVTLRGENAHRVLKNALWVRENRLPAYCFSAAGGLNFGTQVVLVTSVQHACMDVPFDCCMHRLRYKTTS